MRLLAWLLVVALWMLPTTQSAADTSFTGCGEIQTLLAAGIEKANAKHGVFVTYSGPKLQSILEVINKDLGNVEILLDMRKTGLARNFQADDLYAIYTPTDDFVVVALAQKRCNGGVDFMLRIQPQLWIKALVRWRSHLA